MSNFIKWLKIKNFFSIKDEIKIDLKANKYTIEQYPHRLFKFEDDYYNKTISFYGANASGKTSILKSIIVISAIINNNDENILPFSTKNKFANANSKTELTINFVIDNNEYEYYISLNSNSSKQNISISNEILYEIINNRRKTLFNKKEKKINIKLDDEIKNVLFNSLNDKLSVFSEFTKFDTKKLTKIRDFFKNILETTNIERAYTTTMGITQRDERKLVFNIMENGNIKKFIMKFLISIGIDIEDIEVEFDTDDNNQIKSIKNILLYHNIDKKNPLEYQLESDGTKMLLKILLDIYLTYKNKSVLIIDEFDSVLHSMLVPFIIHLMQENNIQFFYTTHNLYNLKFLYSDEIFFIDKNSKHITTISSPKNNKDIEGYENFLSLYENRYLGGLPDIKTIFTKIEE